MPRDAGDPDAALWFTFPPPRPPALGAESQFFREVVMGEWRRGLVFEKRGLAFLRFAVFPSFSEIGKK